MTPRPCPTGYILQPNGACACPPNETPMPDGTCCPTGQATEGGKCCPSGQIALPSLSPGPWGRAGRCCSAGQVTKHLECCGPDLPLQPDGYCACPPGWSRFLDGAACCAPGNIVQNGQCVSLTPSSSQPQMERRCQPDETYRDGRCWPAASAPIIVPPTGVVVPVSPCAPGLVFRNGGCAPAVTAPIVVPPTGVVVPVSPCGPGHILRGGHCWPAATAPIVVPSTSVAVPVSRCGPSQILRGGHCVWPSQLLTNTLRSPGLYHPPLRVGPPTIRRPFVPAPRPTFGRRPFRWPM